MRDPRLDPDTLSADQARGDLFVALRPVLAMVAQAAGENELPDAWLDRLQLLVQPGEPFGVRVVLEATDAEPAVDLGVIRGSELPGRGEVLRQSALLFTAALCSALGEVGERAIAAAAHFAGRGGFVVAASLAPDAPLRLLLSVPGEDLADAIELGRVADAPLPIH